jgi:hypothetical protein
MFPKDVNVLAVTTQPVPQLAFANRQFPVLLWHVRKKSLLFVIQSPELGIQSFGISTGTTGIAGRARIGRVRGVKRVS